MRERIFAILLLTVWLFQNFFCSMFFELERLQCREAFETSKARLLRNEIHTFTFARNQKINWEETDRELKMDGNMFDVISISKSSTTTTVRCVSDNREDMVLSFYMKFLRESGKSRSSDKAKTKTQFPDLKYISTPIVLNTTNLSQPARHFVRNMADISPIYFDIITPPPVISPLSPAIA